MSYDPTQLSSSPVYRLRFKLQDNDVDNEFLVDDEYQYVLDKNSGNEVLSCLEAARRILAQLSQMTRQRENSVEVYGNILFDQWRQYLNELIEELLAGNVDGLVLIGGVSAAEIDRVRSDEDSVGPGYTLNYLEDQRTHTFGSGLSGTNRFRRSSLTSFRLK